MKNERRYQYLRDIANDVLRKDGNIPRHEVSALAANARECVDALWKTEDELSQVRGLPQDGTYLAGMMKDYQRAVEAGVPREGAAVMAAIAELLRKGPWALFSEKRP